MLYDIIGLNFFQRHFLYVIASTAKRIVPKILLLVSKYVLSEHVNEKMNEWIKWYEWLKL